MSRHSLVPATRKSPALNMLECSFTAVLSLYQKSIVKGMQRTVNRTMFFLLSKFRRTAILDSTKQRHKETRGTTSNRMLYMHQHNAHCPFSPRTPNLYHQPLTPPEPFQFITSLTNFKVSTTNNQRCAKPSSSIRAGTTKLLSILYASPKWHIYPK